MTRKFGSRLFVIPNLIRDLALEFRIWVLKPRPVGGVLYPFAILYLRMGSHWEKGKYQEKLGSGIKK